jgi:hypothetical protein
MSGIFFVKSAKAIPADFNQNNLTNQPEFVVYTEPTKETTHRYNVAFRMHRILVCLIMNSCEPSDDAVEPELLIITVKKLVQRKFLVVNHP